MHGSTAFGTVMSQGFLNKVPYDDRRSIISVLPFHPGVDPPTLKTEYRIMYNDMST